MPNSAHRSAGRGWGRRAVSVMDSFSSPERVRGVGIDPRSARGLASSCRAGARPLAAEALRLSSMLHGPVDMIIVGPVGVSEIKQESRRADGTANAA